MDKNRNCFKSAVVLLLSIFLFINLSPTMCRASTKQGKRRVIVSMGDSYSAGEGIPEFYGQENDRTVKTHDQDWLAHRSTKSWPGQLALSDIGFMKDHRSGAEPNWYFVAASGAETKDLYEYQQKKHNNALYWGTEYLTPQLYIFDYIDVVPDYVTLTLGGNDADFADIIVTAVTSGSFLAPGKLTDKLNNVWEKYYEYGGIKDRLFDAYKSIDNATNHQSCIIVAGYPQLLDPEGGGFFFSKKEAETINKNVTLFNNAIEAIVNTCHDQGMNIKFVSVEAAFENNRAYSDHPFINGVMLPQKEDLNKISLASAYSMHPNKEGAIAYAECVQKAIDEEEGVSIDPSLIQTVNITDTPTPEPTEEPSPTPTPYPDPKEVGPYYITAESTNYQNYYAYGYTFSEDGLSGTFQVETFDSYSQEDVDSNDLDYPFFYQPQENGEYYILDEIGWASTTYCGEMTLPISPNVVIIDGVWPFSPDGFYISYESHFYKDVNDYKEALKREAVYGNPDVYIRVENNEITYILINPCQHEDWKRSTFYDMYDDYYVESYAISNDGLYGTFELNSYDIYNYVYVRDLEEGAMSPEGIEITYIDDYYFTYNIYGDDRYLGYFSQQRNGWCYYFDNTGTAATTYIGIKTLPISPDVEIIEYCNPFAEINYDFIEGYQHPYNDIFEFKEMLESDDLLWTPELVIRVEEGEIVQIFINPSTSGRWHN